MIVVESYPVAVIMCFITMLCWGSWANTQKLASKEWRFQLFYWDYVIGVLLLAILFALTMGNIGAAGRGFFEDLSQAGIKYIGWAMLGGVIFNLSNILLVAAIDIAGMSVAFPIGCGLSLILGTTINYIGKPEGNPNLLFLGVGLVTVAAIMDALAYGKLPSQGQKTTTKGILISIAAGVLMGFFYRFVMKSMELDFADPTTGKLSPYTATVFFSLGLFLSNFVWNSLVMVKPFVGEPVPFRDYFTKGNAKLHTVGILGGVIWGLGTTFNIIAAPSASPAIAFGLGYGGIMVAALWGVFIWKEFKEAPAGTNKLLVMMFVLYILGLASISISRKA